MAEVTSSAGRRANRLATQASPYLLQHAHNPVDWFPWGPEAFDEARRRDVPILLSVGYSTCYWCHVMERESFEDPAIGALMSGRFVCVKLDREERPDLDEAYMTATQLMTGRGGWPMTVFIEPALLRPFWCGTYFPPEPRHGLPSFRHVLDRLHEAWRDRRAEVLDQATSLAAAVAEQVGGAAGSGVADSVAAVGASTVTEAASELLKSADRSRGGFGGAPKFPQPQALEFLLDVRAAAGDDATRSAIDAVVRGALDAMATGGLRDHAGGGFHRYCVDAAWTVPHFEKMLYDNALLAGVYARASALYGDRFYRGVALGAIEAARRDLRGEAGGFWSALDAETLGREGLTYLWTPDQVAAALPPDDAAFVLAVYGLDRGPNFNDPHHPGPANVLRLADRPERVAAAMGIDAEAFEARLDRVNAGLLAFRRLRPQPRSDDKVITAWNGMMIAALARAAVALDDPRCLELATVAAESFRGPAAAGATLPRSTRDGRASGPALLEDHAHLALGLVELSAALATRGDVAAAGAWLATARRLVDQAIDRFGDGDGGYFEASASASDLFVRARSIGDGATPGGAATLAWAMLGLRDLLEMHDPAVADRYAAAAVAAVRRASDVLAGQPRAYLGFARVLLRVLHLPVGSRGGLAAGPASRAAPAPREFLPVEVYADADRILVSETEPAVLSLVVRIADGHHVAAADSAPGLAPLRVGVRGGAGVAVFADYPPGDADPADPAHRVYRGTVEFRVLVERSGEWTGRPVLTLSYQACTDRDCLAPRTVELDVAIDRA